MSNADPPLERRFEELAEQVRELNGRVDGLTRQVAALSSDKKSADGAGPEIAAPSRPAEAGEAISPALAVGETLSTATILSSLASVCFVLVIALVLRLIVDRQIINQRFGTFLGVGYAIVLVAYGFLRYAKSRHIVPVFTLSGLLLLFSIVYETHTRFGLLSTPLAFGLLALAVISMTVMGLCHRVAVPLSVGVLGASIVGLSLDFPQLHYPSVALLLLLANGAAYAAIRIDRCRWLIWPMLMLTLTFGLWWVSKIQAPTFHDALPGPELAVPWFLPMIALFAAAYVAMAVWSARRENWSYPELENVLPAIGVTCAYLAARAVLISLEGPVERVALVAAGVAVALVVLSVVIPKPKEGRKGLAVAFAFAAVVLWAISLPQVIGNLPVALLLWSGAAFGIAVIAWIRLSPPARGLACLLQVFTCAVALVMKIFFVLTPLQWLEISAALILSAVCLLHYGWNRSRAVKPVSPFFRGAAVLLLLAAFVYGFGVARIALLATLNLMGAGSPDSLLAGQSILINASALVLMFVGLRWKNGEILTAAFIAALVGAAKVFGHDMLHVKDLPLVLSVLAFGITAAGGSLMWKRWQRLQPVPAPLPPPAQAALPD